MRLQNKTVMITGGASGIGLATVRLFLKEGAQVAFVDRNEERGKALEKELQETYHHVRFYRLDVTNRDQVDHVVQAIVQDFGGIDVLINNAGITKDNMFKKMPFEAFQQVMDVNVSGVFHCAQAVLSHLLDKGKGKIINTSSITGIGGNIGQSNYAASKAAVIGLTKTWAKEFGKKGINVNAVAPGFIETEMTETIPDNVKMQMSMITSSPRFGQAIDVANAYLFLASDESAFINGHVLSVDGGMMK
ncbi:SDR family NAD(P)-dependent oxidoreductase [Paenisporosarcina cavernae]|uniref:Glucose 1-dehydrogenase n=1 Tax=Paenisporosarcina cavernae TaxID=2320858 RepID=A0A385YUG7_9BACL|nr:3-oxoacyl-ACP reductase FabG [Paenisporosarcina cavernae]AYC30535.1 glucose 1-dehydrogenase [Paenisporosarcina cavernae]